MSINNFLRISICSSLVFTLSISAQEVEEVLPEIVATREDGTKAVRYERICALLIESVKELKKEIEELKTGA